MVVLGNSNCNSNSNSNSNSIPPTTMTAAVLFLSICSLLIAVPCNGLVSPTTRVGHISCSSIHSKMALSGWFDNWGAGGSGKDDLDEQVRKIDFARCVFLCIGEKRQKEKERKERLDRCMPNRMDGPLLHPLTCRPNVPPLMFLGSVSTTDAL